MANMLHPRSSSRPASRSSPIRSTHTQRNELPVHDVFANVTSQQLHGLDPARTLISPPPEDSIRTASAHQPLYYSRSGSEPAQPSSSTSTHPLQPLRSATNAIDTDSSKRKRAPPSPSKSHMKHAGPLDRATRRTDQGTDEPLEATPNPKPRKQKRNTRAVSPESPTRSILHRRSKSPAKPTSPARHVLFQSPPPAPDADADYIPPPPATTRARQRTSSRARSATPIPHYEPPTERFTPPREVLMTPSPSKARVSKSSKRKSVAGRAVLKLLIKKELPDIDLSKPPPPPSPSDDPLLLRGRPRRQKTPVRVMTPTIMNTRDTPSMASTSPPDATFRVPSPPADEFNPIDLTLQSGDESDTLPAPPVFDFTGADGADDGWSSGEEGGQEHQAQDGWEDSGEFTGKFTTVSVPTKADPPTSATRTRVEHWGRPKSPHPLKTKGRVSFVEEGEGEEGAGRDEEMDEEMGREFETEIELDSAAGPSGTDQDQDNTRAAETGDGQGSSGAGADKEDDMEQEQPSFADEGPPPPDEPSESPERHSPEPDAEDESPERHSSEPRDEAAEDAAVPSLVDGAEEDRDVEEPEPMSLEHPEQSEPQSMDLDVSQEYPVHISAGDIEPPIEDMHDREIPLIAEAELSFESTVPEENPAELGDVATPQDISVQPVRQEPLPEEDDPSQYFERELSYISNPEDKVQPLIQSERSLDVEMEEEEEEEAAIDRHLSSEPDLVDDDFSREVEVLEQPEEDEDMIYTDNEAEERSEDEEEEDEEEDPSVVKIVSDNPWAAARAAAILKSHDYDMIVKDVNSARRSPRTVQSLMKGARRADASASGVSKSVSPARGMGRGFTPSSPSMTLPELLHTGQVDLLDAEPALTGTPRRSAGAMHPFRTPSPAIFAPHTPEPGLHIDTDGPRDWSRSDWKLLDACFTDERLEVGQHRAVDGESGVLGDVDRVDLDNVVDRFVALLGGADVIARLGSGWTREDLLKRAKALQNKQRAGNVAPPTPTLRQSSVSSTTPSVPDFTPLNRGRFVWSSNRRKLAAPTFSSRLERPPLPPSLLGPRYSHLMEEAISVSRSSDDGSSVMDNDDAELPMDSDEPSVASESTIGEEPQAAPAQTGIGSRVKGFFFSYLPTLSKSKSPPKAPLSARPGLPLPPPEVLEKPRGPISTPVSKPPPKPSHPKELVNLHPAPPPPSKIPRLQTRPRPKRLVDLRPVTSIPEPSQPIRIPNGPRSSGGSVKDLVRSFEEMDNSSSSIGRPSSQMSMRSQSGTTETKGSKPAWKP